MNKRGFFAISIIFSFFIVFLLILVMNLATYSQNRILLGQVKKDIKSNLNLKVPSKKCKKIDGISNDITAGDKFLCDVNGDGEYSNTNEIFYFISSRYNTETGIFDEEENSDNYTTVLLSTKSYSVSNYQYYDNALQFTNDWKNVRLVSTTRIITNHEGNVMGTHNYTQNSSRLLTYQEIKKFIEQSCSANINGDGIIYVNNCSNYNKIMGSDQKLWLETIFDNSSSWFMYTANIQYASNTRYDILVRPAIEVQKNELDLKIESDD